jgi:hypothetical protein
MQITTDVIQGESASGKPFSLYYILVIDDKDARIATDEYISEVFMNVPVDKYRTVLMEKYGAYRPHIDVYFNTFEEVQHAIDEYIVPGIVMNRLANS